MSWFDSDIGTLPVPAGEIMEAVTPAPDNLMNLANKLGFEVIQNEKGDFIVVPQNFAQSADRHSIDQFIDLWLGNNPEKGRIEADRRQRNNSYALIDQLEAEAIVALDGYADEMLGVGFFENPIEIVYKGANTEIKELIETVLQRNNFYRDARSIARDLIKWGDVGCHLKIDNTDDPASLQMEFVTPEKWEIAIPEDSRTPLAYKYLENYNPYSRSKAAQRMKKPKVWMNPWEFVQFTIPNNQYKPYGRGLLENFRTSFDQLVTIEALLALSRASRVERLVVKVPTGSGGNPAVAFAQVANIRAQWKNLVYSDPSVGRRSYAKTPALTDVLFFPSDQNYDIDTLKTTIDISTIDDVTYFRDKALMMTGMPKGYFLADQTMYYRGDALAAQDLKFARKLLPLQNAFAYCIVKLCMTLASYSKTSIENLDISVLIKRPVQVSEKLLNDYTLMAATAVQLIDGFRGMQIPPPQLAPDGPQQSSKEANGTPRTNGSPSSNPAAPPMLGPMNNYAPQYLALLAEFGMPKKILDIFKSIIPAPPDQSKLVSLMSATQKEKSLLSAGYDYCEVNSREVIQANRPLVENLESHYEYRG